MTIVSGANSPLTIPDSQAAVDRADLDRLDNADQPQDGCKIATVSLRRRYYSLADDTVANNVGADRNHAHHKQPSTIRRRPQKVEIRGLLVGLFRSEGSLDLLHLVLYERIVHLAVCVRLGEDAQSPVLVPVSHEEAWALGDIEEENNNDDRSDSLEQDREAPGPGGLDVETAKADPSGKNTADIGKADISERQRTTYA